ncbi:MAG: DJ-1/PfpI family protein [Bacilli bacterium]|nr:DJ-1/PfpI family protein [Bacilli bacterium]
MKNALILLADGFEETEALATHDILNRTHEIKPILCSIKEDKLVTSSASLRVYADLSLGEIDPNDYAFLVLPGGKKGVENLKGSSKVKELIETFLKSQRGVYAICAAPSILAELGYLDDATYTCFPGFETGNGDYSGKEVEIDGKWITARSMAYTIPFAEAIVKKELGEEALKRIHPGTQGIR